MGGETARETVTIPRRARSNLWNELSWYSHTVGKGKETGIEDCPSRVRILELEF